MNPGTIYDGAVTLKFSQRPYAVGPMEGHHVTVHDADTGEALEGVVDLRMHATPFGPITVTLLQFVDAEGKRTARPVPADGEGTFLSGEFTYVLTEVELYPSNHRDKDDHEP